MAENTMDTKWKECGADLGLTEKTIAALEKADVWTLADFDMVDVAGLAELRADGVTLGQANKLKALVQNKRWGSKLDGTAPCMQAAAVDSSQPGVRKIQSME